jgi:hypothetical protein
MNAPERIAVLQRNSWGADRSPGPTRIQSDLLDPDTQRIEAKEKGEVCFRAHRLQVIPDT